MEEKVPVPYMPEDNPIPEIIDGCTYAKLKRWGLLNMLSVRNYCIKKRYHDYLRRGLCMYDSLQKVSEEYGLSFEYLRKMVGVKIIYKRRERKIVW
ncbi:MAG: hypothetical protein ACM3U0_02165 [archaeon]